MGIGMRMGISMGMGIGMGMGIPTSACGHRIENSNIH